MIRTPSPCNGSEKGHEKITGLNDPASKRRNQLGINEYVGRAVVPLEASVTVTVADL